MRVEMHDLETATMYKGDLMAHAYRVAHWSSNEWFYGARPGYHGDSGGLVTRWEWVRLEWARWRLAVRQRRTIKVFGRAKERSLRMKAREARKAHWRPALPEARVVTDD